jgi:MFS transporter, AAHS family, 4-hydroxybenzoate transporter
MAELIPSRSRAAFIIIAFIGAFVGSAAPSAVMAMAPDASRVPALWLVGGLMPLLVAAGAAWQLPESLQFLATRPEQRERLQAMIRRLQPGTEQTGDVAIDLGHQAGTTGTGILRQLFSGRLAIATPLLWVCFICSLAAIYFLSNWLPLLFVQRGIPAPQAAWITALYHIGAGVGSVVISGLMDRFGFLLLTGLFFSSIVPIALIAQPTTSVAFLGWATAAAGFLGQNIQLALNAGAGVIYPTRFRSKAVGAAFAVGRTGAIAGPMLGGVFFGMKLPVLVLFVIPIAPMIVGGVCAAVITAVLYRAQRTFRVSEIVD